jgi:pimeloyl-ACP methyl ester carboxylesterase
MSQPETRYARSGDVSIAYQVSGAGPFDLVISPGWVTNLELFWEDPNCRAHFERLGKFSRLIRFDKRGTGLSDRVAGIADMETRMDDVRAVLDAAGSERAAGYRRSCPRPAAVRSSSRPHRRSEPQAARVAAHSRQAGLHQLELRG